MSHPEIRFIKNKEIDYQKWDQCIAHSPHGIAYAYSWYLDRICPSWDALIWGNYLYVMPLVNNSKVGIRYIYQPFFTQQLGVFSSFTPEPEIVNEFLHAIPEQFRLIDMKLNIGNNPTASKYKLSQNTTFHLALNKSYPEICTLYNTNTRRNIQKAIQNKIYISQVYDIPFFLEFTQNNLAKKAPVVKPQHYAALSKVISHAIYNQMGQIYGAYDSANELVAAAFFLTANQKSIYLAASSDDKGTGLSAMFLLVDTFIRNNSEKNMILDFEGSNHPGIARFYRGFGAFPMIYYSAHANRLPAFLRWMKK